MGARQHAVANFNRAHGAGVAAVDPRLTRQNLAADNAGFDVKQHAFYLDAVEGGTVCLEVCHDQGIGVTASVGAGLFVANLVGSAQALLCQRRDPRDQWLVFGRSHPIPGRFSGIAHEVMDRVDGDIALLMAEDHSTKHDLFAELLGFRLNHQHSGFSASHHQIHDGTLACGLARVEHILAIDVTDPGRTDGASERNATDGQGRTGGDQRCNISVDFRVERQGVNHHLNLIEKTFGKQGANRPINQATGQGFKFAGPAFAFEKTARNLARSVGFFQVIDSQREKVLAGFGVFGGHHRSKHNGVIDVDQHGAASLSGDFAGFHGDRVLAPGKGFGHFIEHAHFHIS